MPIYGPPNEHLKTPKGTKERWYDNKGNPVKDRHNTDHGNPKQHPNVPHEHDWYVEDKGNYTLGKGHKPGISGFETVSATVGIAASVYLGYTLIKWISASIAAPFTGGGSLIVAGVTP